MTHSHNITIIETSAIENLINNIIFFKPKVRKHYSITKYRSRYKIPNRYSLYVKTFAHFETKMKKMHEIFLNYNVDGNSR